MIISLEKLIHAVFVGEIAKLGDLLEGKGGGCHQFFYLGKLLTIDLLLQRFARLGNEYSVKMSLTDVEFL